MEYIELRKGNLIYFPFIKENVEVIGINALWGNPYFNKLSVKNGLDMYYESIDIFKPTPLTEECLLKLGFNERIYKNNQTLIEYYSYDLIISDDFLCTIEYNNNEKYCYLDFEGTKNSVKIFYVHQLQNLYFALTGQELTIKK